SKFDGSAIREPDRIRAFENEFPHSSALVDHGYAAKLFRKLEPGIHPGIEIGHYLTEVAGFANAPALLGTVELIEPDGSRSAIATLHAQIQNQGDAWAVTAAYLDRFVEEQNLLHDGEGEEQAPHLRHLTQIGRRLAELHMTLATDAAGPAFTPEPVPATELKHWSKEIVASAETALDILKARRDVVKEINRPLLDLLLAQRAALPNILESLLPEDGEVIGIRHHGNFHLEQVLIVKDYVFITDFNGEPRRTLAERRRKAPPVRDVA